jgi:hypothetical protein
MTKIKTNHDDRDIMIEDIEKNGYERRIKSLKKL